MKTAQILIIGDEILTGRTADSNSNYLAKSLFIRGVRVQRIEVIPDNLVLIGQWIRNNHDLADFIFVAGGIGGTPDDMTRQGVANGLGVELKRNKAAEEILLKYYGEKINSDRMLMADLPEGCELIENTVTHAPGFKIKNIYVFAGVPKILHAMFEKIQNEITGEPLFEEELKLKVGEGDIAQFMKVINKEFPLLELGSYPNLEPDRGYKTQLVFRATSQALVQEALLRFKELSSALL
jgi:molybdenum cofactor synthesis domain-containing protein